MRLYFALLAAAVASTSAHAEVSQSPPEAVCQYLADAGLAGRKWVADYGDGTSGCASNYKDIGAGEPLANNLAYYVNGERQKVRSVKLVLNYNQPGSSQTATQALISAAQKLSDKALGANLPASVVSLIQAGKPGTVKAGRGEVVVVRSDWPTGKGYEIQVIMR